MKTTKLGASVVKSDFKQLEKLINSLKSDFYVDVGVIGASESYDDGATIAYIGSVHEFGSEDGKIPKRSFIRMPLEKKQSRIQSDVDKKAPGMIAKGNVKGIFELIGVSAEGVIADAFNTGGFGLWPDIKEETKERKGSSGILKDQLLLAKSVASRVGGKE